MNFLSAFLFFTYCGVSAICIHQHKYEGAAYAALAAFTLLGGIILSMAQKMFKKEEK